MPHFCGGLLFPGVNKALKSCGDKNPTATSAHFFCFSIDSVRSSEPYLLTASLVRNLNASIQVRLCVQTMRVGCVPAPRAPRPAPRAPRPAPRALVRRLAEHT